MQFSVDAKGIPGLSSSRAMKEECQPRLGLPAIKSTDRQSSDGALVLSGRRNSKPSVAESSVPAEPKSFVYDRAQHDPAEMTPRTLANVPSHEYQNRKPTGMTRAKVWSLDVENSFRYQLAGFQDISDYLTMYSCPEIWPDTGFIKCLQSKKTGYFLYFRQHRECEDKYLNRVKLYTR